MAGKRNFGVVVAVEAGAIQKRYGDGERLFGPFGVKVYRRGIFNVYVAACDAGVIRAAASAQHLIDRYGVELVANFGVVGACDENLRPGDTVLVNEVVHHDHDVSTVDGVRKGQYEGLDGVNLLDYTEDFTRAYRPFTEMVKGCCASGDKFMDSAGRKRELNREYGALVCDMEAAGVAMTCAENGVPCVVVKTVADSVGGGAKEYWEWKDEAADRCFAVLDGFLSAVAYDM